VTRDFTSLDLGVDSPLQADLQKQQAVLSVLAPLQAEIGGQCGCVRLRLRVTPAFVFARIGPTFFVFFAGTAALYAIFLFV